MTAWGQSSAVQSDKARHSPAAMTTGMFYTQIESPLGPLLLVADEAGLRQILFVNGRHAAQPESSWKEDSEPFREAIRQLQTYFAGELEKFDLQLAPEGTPFQLEVWRNLCEIPYGATVSYGELAIRIGNPKACRAVGLANGSNPIPSRDSVPSRDRQQWQAHRDTAADFLSKRSCLPWSGVSCACSETVPD